MRRGAGNSPPIAQIASLLLGTHTPTTKAGLFVKSPPLQAVGIQLANLSSKLTTACTAAATGAAAIDFGASPEAVCDWKMAGARDVTAETEEAIAVVVDDGAEDEAAELVAVTARVSKMLLFVGWKTLSLRTGTLEALRDED